MTAIRWFIAHIEGWRFEAAMTLFGQGSTWDYCQRCWRKADSRRPLHQEVLNGHGLLRMRHCEPCTTTLDLRKWPCSSCSSLTYEEFDAYVSHGHGLVHL